MTSPSELREAIKLVICARYSTTDDRISAILSAVIASLPEHYQYDDDDMSGAAQAIYDIKELLQSAKSPNKGER